MGTAECAGTGGGISGVDALTRMPVTQRPTDCSCLALPYALADGRCVHGCGLSKGGPYASIAECCDNNFSGGDSSLGDDGCMAEDECPPGR